MNIQNIMAQAQRMQRELEKVSKEIEETKFEGESGAVKVVIMGNYKVISITINDTVNDNELLSDMIMVATNDALNQIKKMKDSKLGKYTNGLGGLI